MTTLPAAPTTGLDEIKAGLALLAAGHTLGSLAGITDEELEAMYSLGYAHYNQARYDDAFQAFSVLVMQNHVEPRYLLALASTHQAMGHWPQAIQYYTLASLLDLDDPKPTFHTGECLVQLGLTAEAEEAFAIVIAQSRNKPRLNTLEIRAEQALAQLRATRAVGAPTTGADK